MTEKIEKKSDKKVIPGKNGGYRPGSGRKPGKLSKKTIEKNEIKKAIEERIARSADNLINSQMNLAQGCQFLMVIRTVSRYDKKTKKTIEERKKPEVVEDLEVIKAYLAGELEDEKDEYFFMTTHKPDNSALNSLLDRSFGKARQNIGLDGGEEDKPIKTEIANLEEGLKKWASTK